VRGVGIAPVKGAKSIGATAGNVRAGKYPYWRYLYFVNYSAHPKSAEAQSFVDFALSSAGQKIAAKEYLPLH
jgi:ABC-type phosphate transport system substrate-binding protein